MSKNLFKTSILKDVILGEKLYDKLFHRKDKEPFFETIDTTWVEPEINSFSEPIDNWVVDDVEEWVEPEINSFSEPIDVEEWNQNMHNIFQNISEEKRLEILKLFATKD